MLIDGVSSEDTEGGGLHLSVKSCLPMCVSASVKNEEEGVHRILNSSTQPFPRAACKDEHTHTHRHTHTHLFSQQAKLPTPRVSFAEVSCRGDHHANTPAVRIRGRAVHLPALLRARVQALHTGEGQRGKLDKGIWFVYLLSKAHVLFMLFPLN